MPQRHSPLSLSALTSALAPKGTCALAYTAIDTLSQRQHPSRATDVRPDNRRRAERPDAREGLKRCGDFTGASSGEHWGIRRGKSPCECWYELLVGGGVTEGERVRLCALSGRADRWEMRCWCSSVTVSVYLDDDLKSSCTPIAARPEIGRCRRQRGEDRGADYPRDGFRAFKSSLISFVSGFLCPGDERRGAS